MDDSLFSLDFSGTFRPREQKREREREKETGIQKNKIKTLVLQFFAGFFPNYIIINDVGYNVIIEILHREIL